MELFGNFLILIRNLNRNTFLGFQEFLIDLLNSNFFENADVFKTFLDENIRLFWDLRETQFFNLREFSETFGKFRRISAFFRKIS